MNTFIEIKENEQVIGHLEFENASIGEVQKLEFEMQELKQKLGFLGIKLEKLKNVYTNSKVDELDNVELKINAVQTEYNSILTCITEKIYTFIKSKLVNGTVNNIEVTKSNFENVISAKTFVEIVNAVQGNLNPIR